jgi:hypothetical protein
MSGSSTITTSYGYNTNGQLQKITYLGNVQERREYDTYGYHVETMVSNQRVWELIGETGRLTTEKLGSNMTATTTRNVHGLLTKQNTVAANVTNPVHNMEYSFNVNTGNLSWRKGMIQSSETFGYDKLNRLTGILADNDLSVYYAPNGNITKKTDVGSYTYVPGKPHAVETVENTSKLISDKDQSISYNAFGKAQLLTESTTSGYTVLSITYGPDQQRWKSE